MHATIMISIKRDVKAEKQIIFSCFFSPFYFRWKMTWSAVFVRFTAWLMWSGFVQNNGSISYAENMSLSLCLATDQQYETYPWQPRKCAAGCHRSMSDRSSELPPLPVRCSAASWTGPEALETHKHSQRFHLCMWLRAITVKNTHRSQMLGY